MIYDVLAEQIGHLYQIRDELPYQEEFQTLMKVAKKIQEWRNTYIRDQCVFHEESLDSQTQVFVNGVVDNSAKKFTKNLGNLKKAASTEFHADLGVKIRLSKVEGSEVRYESQLYGLVGIVDSILLCEIEDLFGNKKELSIPFELKTGKNIKDSYECQVQLYNLMMNEHVGDRDTGYGIVYYSNLDIDPIFTKMVPSSLYNIFINRNMMVSKEKVLKGQFKDLESLQIPPRTLNTNNCRFCEVKNFCVTLDTYFKSYNSLDKKKAFVLKTETENDMNLVEISGLMEYKHNLDVKEAKRRSTGVPNLKKPANAVFGANSVASDQSSFEGEDWEREIEEFERNRIKQNLHSILDSVKFPDIEDIVTEEQPDFYGLEEIFRGLDKLKIDYFARWMDLILLEEN